MISLCRQPIRTIGRVLFTGTVFITFITFFSATCVPDKKITTPPTEKTAVADTASWNIRNQYRLLGKCMNLGNALDAPTEGAWGTVLQESYFKHVKSLGFQSVRIPVRWSTHLDSTAPYTIDETFFKRVQWAVDQALANDLRVIVNVHHFESLMSDANRYSPMFLAIWEQISARFSKYGPQLYFELCNEPNKAVTSEIWNDLAAKALAAVRVKNPYRSVIIGGADWNSAHSLDMLSLPKDNYLIATFHSYDPIVFTHQGASWVNASDVWLGTRWRATHCDTSTLISTFNKVDAWAAANNIQVFLGEFGSIDTADTISRVLYTAFIAQQAQTRGWSYAYWKYNGNFGIYDDATNVTRDYLVNALIKPDSMVALYLEKAAVDTVPTPDPGSKESLVLDDFDDTLAGSANPVISNGSCCRWNLWYSDSSRVIDNNGNPVAVGGDGFKTIVGPWGKTANGLHAKILLKGDNYPGFNFTIPLSGNTEGAVDLSDLTAISFQAKGFGGMSVDFITDTVLNGYPPSDSWGHFSCFFEPVESWKHYVIPVAMLTPKPWSKPHQDNLTWRDAMTKVRAISFSSGQIYGKNVHDSLEIFLDDITLHGVTVKKFVQAGKTDRNKK